MRLVMRLFILLTVLLQAGLLCAQEPASSEAQWKDFPKQSVKLDGHAGFVVVPQTAAPGKPWVWRTSFPGYHAEVDEALMRNGFHVAYVNVLSMLGSEGALDVMDQFYALVREEFGLAEKPALEAVSRGGLHAYRYAARRPERIACIYADVPVMDLKSWPLKAKADKQVQDAMHFYGFKNEEELKAFKGNPVDLLAPIAAAKIPLRHVISLNDETVPPEENTLEAKRRLNKLGWDIELVIVKEGDVKKKGHHFPLPEAAESARFIMKHTVAERKTSEPERPTAQLKPKAEAFYTPKQDRAGMTSDTPIDKTLPNVLILGDSISIGYTRQVREGLKGKANVIRPNANCGDTRNGLAQIEKWLGDGNWQVIHFNWGLHDLCYRNPELKTPGQRDKVKGTLSVPLPEYEKNIEILVERLKKTGAKLIFATTTIVPEGEEGRFVGDDEKYNAVAERVMNRHGVIINDLHATTKAFPPGMFAGPANVHYTAEGSAKLATQVVAKVEAALPAPRHATQTKSVLLVGDAVGAQYAESVRDLLKPRIAVQFLAAPVGGKAEVDAFLAQFPALSAKHDLVVYAGVLEAARVSPETGKPELSTAQFRQFLEGLAKSDTRGKKLPGTTKWIWATSVPVPEGNTAISVAKVEACNRTLTDLAYNRRAMLLDL
ncbi:MAG: hypothetical protein FJ279_32270, partial [Planctomycetes bacterium]|nr:hypothetical protein [Planctomycetota bacterium]